MQRFFFRSLLVLLIVLAGRSAHANHVSGADFFYEHVSDSTYKISLWIYGNCKSVPVFNSLNGATPQVLAQRNGALIATVTLAQVGPGVEVTPVCPAEQNNTTCKNVNNTIPGVTRYIYEGTYTMPSRSANWVFRFEGTLIPGPGGSTAGRSNTITNINNPGASVMALEARLNNLNTQNSSPQFTTIPTPFYCINVAQQYNLGASDADNDSLTFALTPGLTANLGGGTVGYTFSYSAIAPLDVAAGSFTFSPVTGQMNFTPQSVQTSLVVQQVNEYRNGVLVGTAMREMNFIVLSNCNNNPATNSIDTAKSANAGGVVVGSTDFNVCEGSDSARFSIVAHNPASNTITASVTALPAGTTYAVANNGSTNPIITFSWKNTTAAPGTYTFYVTYKDNGCPLTSTQTQAYTVHVYKPNALSTTIAAPTQCVHKALVAYNFSYGLLPRSIAISQGGTLVRSFRDTTGRVLDSLGQGFYDVIITSDKLPCPTYLTLRVVDSGLYPNTPVAPPAFYCKFDQALPLTAKGDSGAVVRWYSAGGAALGLAPTPRTDTAGIFTWFVDQKFKVCVSNKDSVKVYVTLRPTAAFSAPDKVCLNDTATFNFTGQIGVGPILDYRWDFDHAGYTVGDSAGPWRVHWYDTGLKVITLRVDENKCPSFPFTQSLFVKPIPFAGFDAGDVCQYDTMRVSYNTNPLPGQTYAWTFPGAEGQATATGPGPYVLSWADSGSRRLTLTVDLDGCHDMRFRDIVVRPVPNVRILNIPTSICIGDKITLLGAGGGTYDWTTSDPLLPRASMATYPFQILRPEAFLLRVKSEFGCMDSDAVAFKDVQPCCNFAYPNAFTPNGDGRNDRFHVVTYGNALEYELSIYNRWGQRVYYGLDPKQGWDGSYAGRLCDAGTYFYYLHAKCFTGHEETQKGELELIR